MGWSGLSGLEWVEWVGVGWSGLSGLEWVEWVGWVGVHRLIITQPRLGSETHDSETVGMSSEFL